MFLNIVVYSLQIGYCPLPAEMLLIISSTASNLTKMVFESLSKCKCYIDTGKPIQLAILILTVPPLLLKFS